MNSHVVAPHSLQSSRIITDHPGDIANTNQKRMGEGGREGGREVGLLFDIFHLLLSYN